jgi:hypothetical protein
MIWRCENSGPYHDSNSCPLIVQPVASRYFCLNWYSGRWSPIGSTQHCGDQWPIVSAPGDYDDGEIGGMISKGNRSTRRKPAPVPLCPPQTPYAAGARTLAATVGSQRLTAWATAWPSQSLFWLRYPGSVLWMGENKNTYIIWRMNLVENEYYEVWDENNLTLNEIVSFLCELNLIRLR